MSINRNQPEQTNLRKKTLENSNSPYRAYREARITSIFLITIVICVGLWYGIKRISDGYFTRLIFANVEPDYTVYGPDDLQEASPTIVAMQQALMPLGDMAFLAALSVCIGSIALLSQVMDRRRQQETTRISRIAGITSSLILLGIVPFPLQIIHKVVTESIPSHIGLKAIQFIQQTSARISYTGGILSELCCVLGISLLVLLYVLPLIMVNAQSGFSNS